MIAGVERRAVAAVLAEPLRAAARARGAPLIGFDTAGPRSVLCLVSVVPGEVVELVFPSAATPSEHLAAALHDELAAARVPAARLGALLVGVGPGSFTGVRVGLAFAKGLALGAPIPLVSASSLALLAAGVGPQASPCLVVPVLDARRGDWFAAAYAVGAPGLPEERWADGVYTPAALRDRLQALDAPRLLFVGDQAQAARKLAGPNATALEVAPSLAAGMVLHQAALAHGAGEPVDTLAPRYLRLSEPERKLAAGSV